MRRRSRSPHRRALADRCAAPHRGTPADASRRRARARSSPELKELVWGAGVVPRASLVLMRLLPVPEAEEGHGRPLRARSAPTTRRPTQLRSRRPRRGRRVRGASWPRSGPRPAARSTPPARRSRPSARPRLAEVNAAHRRAPRGRGGRGRGRPRSGAASRSRPPSATSPAAPPSWPPASARRGRRVDRVVGEVMSAVTVR